MSTSTQNQSESIIIHYVRLFAEKAMLLAVEAYEIFKKSQEIDQIIGIIVLHQAAELTLKALCISKEKDIMTDKGITIGFEKMMKILEDDLEYSEKTALELINKTRNEYQHFALFDVSNKAFLWKMFHIVLALVSKLQQQVGYNPDELEEVLRIIGLESEDSIIKAWEAV